MLYKAASDLKLYYVAQYKRSTIKVSESLNLFQHNLFFNLKLVADYSFKSGAERFNT